MKSIFIFFAYIECAGQRNFNMRSHTLLKSIVPKNSLSSKNKLEMIDEVIEEEDTDLDKKEINNFNNYGKLRAQKEYIKKDKGTYFSQSFRGKYGLPIIIEDDESKEDKI